MSSTFGNMVTSAVLAPFAILLSALSLSSLQRGLEWISSISKGNNVKGWMRDLKPYVKNVETILERITGGNKITINTTNILMTTIVILLLCGLLNDFDVASKANRDKKEAEKKEKQEKKEKKQL